MREVSLSVAVAQQTTPVIARFMGGDIFRAIIPAQPAGTVITVTPNATDRQGNACAASHRRRPLSRRARGAQADLARRARPVATEIISPPARIFAAPKRSSKMRRTAGTKDVPPVMKT